MAVIFKETIPIETKYICLQVLIIPILIKIVILFRISIIVRMDLLGRA